MKVSLGWLGEWIDLPDSVEGLEERLTVGGLEIEEVVRTGPDLSALLVGEVLARDSHPNADRLSLCTVAVGGEEPVEIVCGAPNVAAGQKVAVALHGVVLPDGLKIKRSKIRGVRSNGMICSSRELGLGDDHEGILVLAEGAAVGAPLSEVLPAGDVVFDVGITPNRGDWVSMLGMAREVRAHYGGELRVPPSEVEEGQRATADDVAVEIRDGAGCHRYVARIVRGVTVGPSPPWVQARLEAAGLRAVNNVVDATNLAMLEFGQPLHAFDLSRLRGGRVVVRAAQPGETLRTLDGEERELEPEDLVIADAEGAVAVAGVMGGSESEVHDGTTDLLIESAHFHPSRIRRTARRLGLPTDASYRFERGVDREGVARAAGRAARLIREWAGGEVSRGAVEELGEALPAPPTLRLDPAHANRLLGTELDADEIVALLARVDVEARPEDGVLVCATPAYRYDLGIPEDLIEEIARVHGYDRIPPTLPVGACAGVEQPAERALGQRVRDALCAAGFHEVMTFSAGRPDDLDALRLSADEPRRRVVPIENPIQASEPQLRTTLLPSLLRAAQQNLARQSEHLRLFELSRVFRAGAEEGLPEEPVEAVAVLAGGGADSLWAPREVPLFFEAKGVAEGSVAALGHAPSFQAGTREPFLHPGAAGELFVGEQRVAWVGELHPESAARFALEAPVALVGLDVQALLAVPVPVVRYQPVSKLPRVRRDLALLVDRGVPAGDLADAIRKAAQHLVSVELFDRYEGRGVPEGKVSLAFRLILQHPDRNMTDAEIGKNVDRVVHQLARQYGAKLR